MRRFVALVALCVLALCGRGLCVGDPYLHAAMKSTLLSQFWGKPVSIDAYVLLPASYYRSPQRRYPILYWIQGFDGVGNVTSSEAERVQAPFRSLKHEFIVVFLNGMFNGIDTEFADSPNNGPWEQALLTEFMPLTEEHFRVEGNDRFIGGHSSGGWAAMWLQITNPDIFLAEWSISPDPLDFRDFAGPDITKTPPQNFFTNASGKDYTIAGTTLRRFVRGRAWQARQFESFETVFSPRGSGGPQPLFDRSTGAIDATVQRYWDEHWDIATYLERRWPQLHDRLNGKLHVVVGTRDEFGLDRSVRLFQQRMSALGSDAEFNYAPDEDHSSVFWWKGNLFDYVFTEADRMLPP